MVHLFRIQSFFHKGDANKVVLDARHLNSNTDLSLESWPIEPLATQLARANKNINLQVITCRLMHIPL